MTPRNTVTMDLSSREETGVLNLIQLRREKVTFLQLTLIFCCPVMQLDYRIIAGGWRPLSRRRQNHIHPWSQHYSHIQAFIINTGLISFLAPVDIKTGKSNQGNGPYYSNKRRTHPQENRHLSLLLSCTCLWGVTAPLSHPCAWCHTKRGGIMLFQPVSSLSVCARHMCHICLLLSLS